MSHRNLARALVFTAGIFAPLFALGGQDPTATPSVDALLTRLHAEQWTTRAGAYGRLRLNATALVRTDVRRALLELLDRENHVGESTLRESHEMVGTSGKYGEEHSEYVGELRQTVDSFVDWADPRQVCILAHSGYNPNSVFAGTIATHGKVAAGCLIQMADSDLGAVRMQAAPVLVEIMATFGALDVKTTRVARQVVLRALRDPNSSVQMFTIFAMRDYAAPDMIPALRSLAIAASQPNEHDASIRKWTTEAIAAIQKRAAQRQK
jgi:hypothetical protein